MVHLVLGHLREGVIGLQDGQRLAEELQSLGLDDLAGKEKKISFDSFWLNSLGVHDRARDLRPFKLLGRIRINYTHYL